MTDDQNLRVLLEDLSTDAAKWRAIADALAQAHATGAGVQSAPDMVTDGISYAAGFQEQYNTLGPRAVGYIAEGETAMRGVADRLDATRREYEASEDYALGELSTAERA